MSGDIYEMQARRTRKAELQLFLDSFAEDAEIEPDFVDASEHPGNCTCHKCLKWWATMGPQDSDNDGTLYFGPFTQEEIESYCKESGTPIWWVKSQDAKSADSSS